MYTKKNLPKGIPSNLSPRRHSPYYYLNSLLNEVKLGQHFSDKSFDTVNSLSEELFNIFNHIALFTNQASLMIKKNQNIDTLYNRTKISLINEIASFFDSICLFSNTNNISKQLSSLSISKQNSFTLINKRLDESDSFNYIEEFSNENIIEKIKNKIQKTKTIVNYKTFNSYRNYNTIKTTPNKKKQKISLKFNVPTQRLSTESNAMSSKEIKIKRKMSKLHSRSYSKTSFSRSFAAFSNDLQQNYSNGIIINPSGPKPSNYTTYLMNKSRGVIETYNKISGKRTANSFTDLCYQNNLRPKSSCRKINPRLYN